MDQPEPKKLAIELLCRYPHHARMLARWHFNEWRHLYETWSLEAAHDELLQQKNAAIPTTLIAFGDGENEVDVVGSVSLLEHDLVGYEHLGPWLASLYVRADWRGRGAGKKLVDAALQHARTLGVQRLYLFTPAQREFYLDKGFRDLCNVTANGEPVTVMVAELC
jgi:N-acetylglutamate synthase-like GNAT family acetyltransferase